MKQAHFLTGLLILILTACGQVGVYDLDPSQYSGSTPTSSGSISFAAQVTPILNSKCGAVCHSPSGTAPTPNLNVTGSGLYSTVQPIASNLVSATSTSHPAGAGIFLTSDEQTIITTWASEGAQNN